MKMMKILIAAILFAMNVPTQAVVSTRQILDVVGTVAATWMALRTLEEGNTFTELLKLDPRDSDIENVRNVLYAASVISGGIAADYVYRVYKGFKQKNDTLQKSAKHKINNVN